MIEIDKKKSVNFSEIIKLNLTDFRNHDFTSITTNNRFISLVGENGSGKTNILEAISMFTSGRGLRGAQLSDQSNTNGKGGWSVFMEIKSHHGKTKLGTGISDLEISNGKNRQCRIDGKSIKSPKLFGNNIGIIWLTPQMDRLFIGSRSDRRKFFDKLISLIEPTHSDNIKNYERIITQRNKVLYNLDSLSSVWLDNLEKQLAKISISILLSRQIAVNQINKIMDADVKNNLFPSSKIIMREELDTLSKDISISEMEDSYIKILYRSRKKDKITYKTNIGPHRTDFTLFYKKNKMYAENCSTGEQKNLLISLILAESRVYQENNNGISPVLLLDEVTAHLDQERICNLFDQISELGSQTWLTGTTSDLFCYIQSKADFFDINNGKLTQIKP
ncbi:MAG: DNA replication/repair protein RecF [Hyphomicrobiales bacterium]|nr:DNA replication/repair protein RecF [Hyphomicrobiales bacterium]|tara:strand:- start:9246 stop:10418 length:1173 start_codon:yes stop_codon:yes gene_type:complete